jgi:hypothetical protein
MYKTYFFFFIKAFFISVTFVYYLLLLRMLSGINNQSRVTHSALNRYPAIRPPIFFLIDLKFFFFSPTD